MNNNKTLGRRIQEGRKAAGLSQESLGEQLGVSRQAVSKWESAAAIPELENLIAMSRIFETPVGVLLGVEQAAEPEVETILAQYVPQKQPSRHRAIAVLTAVLLVAGLVFLVWQLAKIERRVNTLQSQVSSIQGELEREIDSMGGQIAAILEAEANILSEYGAEAAGFDPAAQTVTLRIWARPKERGPEATVTFTAVTSAGVSVTTEAALQETLFVAEALTVPMDPHIALSVTVAESDHVRTGPVADLYDCGPDCFRLGVKHKQSQDWTAEDGTVTLPGFTGYVMPVSAVPEMAVTKAEMCLYRNHAAEPEAVWCLVIDDSREPVTLTGEAVTYLLSPGDVMIAALRLEDNFGQVTYQAVDAKKADSQGRVMDAKWRTIYGDGSGDPSYADYSDQALEDMFREWIPGTELPLWK